MQVNRWVRRAARPVRELAFRVAAHGRGLPRTLNGLRVRVDPATRWYFTEHYDPPVSAFLASRVERGSEVWNVGANIGIWVLQLAAWVGPHGRVLAFEPNPAAADLLAENVRLNGITDRVEIVRLAVSDAPGHSELHASGVHGMSRLGQPNPLLAFTKPVSVAVTTLDDVAARRGTEPTWILMDIEGWEIPALRAARHLLRRSRFVVELHPFAWPWSGESRASLEAVLNEFELQAVPLTGQADALAEAGHVVLNRMGR